MLNRLFPQRGWYRYTFYLGDEKVEEEINGPYPSQSVAKGDTSQWHFVTQRAKYHSQSLLCT
jgi:hypothetical protein